MGNKRKSNRDSSKSTKNKQQDWRKQRNQTLKQQNQVRNKFEGKLKEQLEENNIDYMYESFKVEYTLTKNYLPDFAIKANNIIIEAKGVFDSDDRRKHLAIKEQHPDLDIRFVFLRDNKLKRGAKMSYSDWCEYHGFKYAIGEIPEEWLQELPEEGKLDLVSEIDEHGGITLERRHERQQSTEQSEGREQGSSD